VATPADGVATSALRARQMGKSFVRRTRAGLAPSFIFDAEAAAVLRISLEGSMIRDDIKPRSAPNASLLEEGSAGAGIGGAALEAASTVQWDKAGR